MSEVVESVLDEPIRIPYNPRSYFRRFHASTKRHRFMVVHRRGGKTVAIANELIRLALTTVREYPPIRIGYVGPSFSQAKDTIWGYLKHYTRNLPNVVIREDDLSITLPNGARIALYPGAQAYERMRGLYFDAIALDEYALLNDDAWDSVVRPCLADYRGRAIVAGTSNGDDHFHQMMIDALARTDWDVFDFKVDDTGAEALDPDEIADMRRDMDPDKFEREMRNDFSSPIEGAYYASLINEARDEGRIGSFPHDVRYPVVTSWDLGVRDTNCIWFFQRIQGRIILIDYAQGTGKGLDYYVSENRKRRYNYTDEIFPHDVKHREKSTGRTNADFLFALGVNVYVCPSVPPLDRITAVRSILPQCYFDAERCQQGLSGLSAYQSGKNGKPLHNWASHPADAFGHGALCVDLVKGWGAGYKSTLTGALRRRIKGII